MLIHKKNWHISLTFLTFFFLKKKLVKVVLNQAIFYIWFLEKYFLRPECCTEQTHSCEQNLQETRHWRKEGKWSDMGNYRTRVHLTDNATGWDQWQRGDWPVWSSIIASFSVSETELSRSNRKQTSRRRLSVVILMPRFCEPPRIVNITCCGTLRHHVRSRAVRRPS